MTVGIHKWKLVNEQIMNDNTVKHSYNNIKYVSYNNLLTKLIKLTNKHSKWQHTTTL